MNHGRRTLVFTREAIQRESRKGVNSGRLCQLEQQAYGWAADPFDAPCLQWPSLDREDRCSLALHAVDRSPWPVHQQTQRWLNGCFKAVVRNPRELI